MSKGHTIFFWLKLLQEKIFPEKCGEASLPKRPRRGLLDQALAKIGLCTWLWLSRSLSSRSFLHTQLWWQQAWLPLAVAGVPKAGVMPYSEMDGVGGPW